MSNKSKKRTAWSYSSLSLFQQCPYKYYRLRVLKDIKEPESEAMKFGNRMHTAAEFALRENVPAAREFDFLNPYLSKLRAIEVDELLAEQKLALTADLRPCQFFDRDVWWRGIADVVMINQGRGMVWDWKSGNSRYPDTKQLEITALALFRKYPKVEVITGGLIFPRDKITVPYKLKRSQGKERLVYWLQETARLDRAVIEDRWVKRPNFTCKGWCPVEDCPYWEPKRKR